MPILLKVLKNYPTVTPNTVIVQCTFSGSYVTGGDTLNLTADTFTDPNDVGLIGPFVALPVDVRNIDKATDGYYSEVIPGTLLTNYKLRLWQPGGSEYAAGAYGAPFTTSAVLTLHIDLAYQDQ